MEIKQGDKVVIVKWRGRDELKICGEGLVEAVSGNRYKVKVSGWGKASDYDRTEIVLAAALMSPPSIGYEEDTKMTMIESKLREKAGKDADHIISEVKETPDYFVMEGGSDGTYSHVCFWHNYGHLMPEIADFASECGGQV